MPRFSRSLASSIAVVAALSPWLLVCQAVEPATLNLQTKCQPGDVSNIQVSLEVEGNLKLKRNGKIDTVPLNVSSAIDYREQILELDGPANSARRSLRHYDRHEATITIAGKGVHPKLRDDRQLIVAALGDSAPQVFSPLGPLTREELELLDVPGNSLAVELLLPEKGVKTGETWPIGEQTLASLLGLDAVSRADVTGKLESVSADDAHLIVTGTLTGAIGGVSTEIELKGRYRFNLSQRRVTALALAIKETRSIGHVGPGLDVVATLRMLIAPGQQSPVASAAELKKLNLDITPATTAINYESSVVGYRITHDRRWYLTDQEPKLTVLRMVDRGELVAQCNISPLPKLTDGKLTGLEEFQHEVQTALGKNFGQFINASESVTDGGIHIQRAVAVGKVSELPIQWNYYLVTDNQGRRIALSFTLEGTLVERFGEADRALVGSIEFFDPPTTSVSEKPTKKAK